MNLDYLRKAMGWQRLYFGGGSGGTTSTQEFKPPSYTVDAWKDYVNNAGALADPARPQPTYQGQTIAGMQPEQIQAMQMTQQRALYGAPDLNAARGQVTDTANGRFLDNPWTGSGSTLGRTAAGEALNSNPYLSSQYNDAVIGDTANNMANAYRLGTGAQTDAAFARGGAFGGSAYQQMEAANAAGLANSVGQMANQARLGQQGLQSQNYQAERNLQQNASLAGLGAYGAERGNQMQAAGLAGQLSQDDYTAAQSLMGVGDINRAYQQDLFNEGQAKFNQQMQYPYQQLDVIGNALARASGNAAGGATQTTTGGYQASPYASLLGLGALGLGAYGAYKTP